MDMGAGTRADPVSQRWHSWWLWWPHACHVKGNSVSSIRTQGDDAAIAACQRHLLPHVPLASGLNLAPEAWKSA